MKARPTTHTGYQSRSLFNEAQPWKITVKRAEKSLPVLSQFKAIIVSEIKPRVQYDFIALLSVLNGRTLKVRSFVYDDSSLDMSFFCPSAVCLLSKLG